MNVMSKNTIASAQVIPFRKAELLLVDHAGEPFVPMKPVVEGMGLSWASQTVKLNSDKARWGVSMIETPSAGGIQPYLCIPLRKLFGWLNSIHASKVRLDLRDNIIAYQNECDDVLWAYWNEGRAIRTDDRSIETVLGSVIGTSGVLVLDRVIDQKASPIPNGMRRSFKHTMKSRLRSRFNVQRADLIPSDQLADACNFVAAYVLEGEWLGQLTGFAGIIGRPLGPTDRWMVYTDFHGNEQCKPIPLDACVMTRRELLQEMVTTGDMPVSAEELIEFAMAAMSKLKARSAGRSLTA